MRITRALRRSSVVFLAAFVVGAVAAPAVGYHWARYGWQDMHLGYPRKPYGYRDIVDVFGAPCNRRSYHNHMHWTAADNGVTYTVRFHKKLGGIGTRMVNEQGGTSTNLDNDVRGHIGNQHLDGYVKHGIYGYNCRYMRGGRSWSTHAWGIAVDVSSAWEPMGQCYSRVNKHHADIWKNHRWRWGLAWCDAMHFQYARGY